MMSTEPENPSEQVSSTPQEASTHNSNNQTSFTTQYYSYYPTPYDYMGYAQPSYLYPQTMYNTGYVPLQYFPYNQTMYNHLTYAQPQFPYHQSPYNYAHYVQPDQFTAPPVYVSTATETEPLVQPPPPLLPLPSQPQGSLPPTRTMGSRALLLSVMPNFITEAGLRHELEAFGEIRAMQMERLHEGFVTVHFYNVRDAEDVLAAICNRNMQQPSAARGVISEYVTWATFTPPEPSAFPDGDNQGTLVLFNLDPRVSSDHLKEIFEEFGPVKEVRETRDKIYQRFVEFYDVRDAARAMEQLKGTKLYDKKLKIHYARPGGYNRNQGASLLGFSTGNILPPRNMPPLLQRPPPNATVACKLSGRISLSKNPTEGECSRTVGGSDSSVKSATTDLSFSGKLEFLSTTQRDYSLFEIDEDAISDSRTTVMIRNIPNRLSQEELIGLLDEFCMDINAETAVVAGDELPASYDYVYLPIDFMEKANKGYAFVNMTSPRAAIKLYKAFHRQSWHDFFNSTKICAVSYARIQGIKAIKDHFKNKIPSDPENMPVMFLPPRDGRTLTDPLPLLYSDSPPMLPPQHPGLPPSAATSKVAELEVPPAEAAEHGDDETGSDGDEENYFLHMHGLA